MKLLVTSMLLPIGLVLLLLAATVWVATRRRPARQWLIGLPLVAFVVLYVASTPLFGRALSLMIVNHTYGRVLDDPAQANAIVVLTGGMLNAGEVGWLPSPISIQRLAVAYELQRLVNLRMPVIVSGGHTAGVQNPSEAAVTAAFFARHRTELTPTELEESSTDTYEGALQLAPVLARREARTIFLVTSDIHMLRALATFRARGIDPVPFPAMVLPGELGIRAVLPSVYGLKMTTEAAYEIFGVVSYLLTGKISWGDIVYEQ